MFFRAVIFVTLLLLLVSFGLPVWATSGIPQTLSYQGRLANSAGDLLGGTGAIYSFKFSLWDSATVGVGTQVWPITAPTATTATVRAGLFNVNIGDTDNGYPDALDYDFGANNKIFLQIEVSTDGVTYETLSPRQPLTSAPFAQTAESVYGSGVSTMGGLIVNGNSTTTNATTTGASYLGTSAGLNGVYINNWSDLASYSWSTTSADIWGLSKNYLDFGTTSDALIEGTTNIFYTQARVWDDVWASTTLSTTLASADTAFGWGDHSLAGYLTNLLGGLDGIFGNSTTTNATTTNAQYVGGDLTVDTNTLFVDSTNNWVGIGTTSPTVSLDIYADVADVNDVEMVKIDTTSNLSVANSPRYLAFYSNGTYAGDIHEQSVEGNLVLNGQGGFALQRAGTYFLGAGSATLNVYKPFSGATTDGLQLTPGGSARNVTVYAASGQTANIFRVTDNAKTTDYFDISASGNVGIGTTTPNAYLTVNGSSASVDLLQVATSTNQNIFNINNNGASSFGGDLTVDTDTLFVDSANNRVGIGTKSPTQQLTMTGNLQLPVTSATTASGIIYKGTDPFISNFNYGWNGTVTTDGYNTFMGVGSGNLTMGDTATQVYHSSYNSAFGTQSLNRNTTGYFNMAIGSQSLLLNTTGSNNSAMGYQSLYANTTGARNLGLGSQSLYSLTGTVANTSDNIGIGYRAGRYQADGVTALTTASQSIYIGSGAMGYNNSDVNSIVIGYQAKGIGANSVVLGNDSILTTALKGNVGIGTTTPNAYLTVNGSSASVNLLRVATSTNQSIFLIDDNGASSFGGDLTVGGGLSITSGLTLGTLDGLLFGTNGAVSALATSTLNLAVNSFASPNISQWTNDANYLAYGTTSDALTEGTTNLFYTPARVQTALVSGYDAIFGNTTTTNVTTTNFAVTGNSNLATTTISTDLTVDTSTLYVDSANNRVGVGTASPDSTLNVRKPDAFDYVGLLYLGNTTDNTAEAKLTAGTAFIVGPHSTNGEYTWIGKSTTFDTIYVDLATQGSSVTYVWEYSIGSGNWSTLTVTDGTDSLTDDGSVTFTPPADWATDTVNSYTGYLVRVRPTTDPATHPTAYLVVPTNTDVLKVYANNGDTVPSLRVGRNGNVGINLDTNATYDAYKFVVYGTSFLIGATLNAGTFGQYQTQGTNRTAGLSTYSGGTATAVAPLQYSPTFEQYGNAWENSNTTDVAFLQSTSTAAQETAPYKVWFSPDGLQMYVLGNTGNDITYYTLSSAWNISTASYVSQFQVGTPTTETTPTGMYFKSDGLKFWIVGQLTDTVYQFSMSSAWDMSTASYDGVSFSVSAEEATPSSVFFRPDGKQMYIMGSTGDDVNIYNLSTAWDVTTAVYSTVFSVSTQESGPQGLYFSSDGYKMYVIGNSGDDVNIYRLGVAWDVTTAAYRTIYSVSAESNPLGIFWRSDGLKFYTIGSSLQTVREYDVVVPWEINTVALATRATYYSQVMPVSANPITAKREDGFRYGTSEYRPFWNWMSDGKVGFGTSTPTYKLSIQSDNSTEDLLQVGTTTNNSLFTIDKTGASTFSNDLVINGTASSTGLQVNGNSFLTGTLSVGTTSVASTFNLQALAGISALNITSSIGSSMLTVAGNGYVGIGTTTPNAYLTVNGSSASVDLLRVATSTNQSIFLIDNNGASSFGGDLTVNGNASTAGTLNVGGNTRYWKMSTLDLTGSAIGDVGYYPLLSGYSDGTFGNVGVMADSMILYDTADDDLTSINFAGNQLSSIGSIEYDNQTYTFNFDELLGDANVFVSGKVGIGTTTPAYKLDVVGDMRVGSTTNYWVTSELDLSGSALGNQGYYPLLSAYSNGPFGNVGAIADAFVLYDTQDDDYTTISFAGNQLSSIGTLDYDNQSHTFIFDDVVNGTANVEITGNATTTGAVALSGINAQLDGNVGVCIDANGLLYRGASGSSCDSSSLRYKHDVVDSSAGLAELLRLRPVTFYYNRGSDPSEQLGFIAEEVNEVDPRLVQFDASGTPSALQYDQFPSVIVKAIQDMHYNLTDITASTTDSEGNLTFAGKFLGRLVAWLGDISNGVTDFFAKTTHQETLCVGDSEGETCITKEQLDTLLQQASVSSVVAPTSDPTPAPVDPAPVDPVDPVPTDPDPVDSDPTVIDPDPIDPAPVDPAPVDPAPSDPAPTDPAPTPAPVPEPAL